MTVQCTFGTEPKPSSGIWSFYTDSDVTALLGAAGGWLSLWALGVTSTPFEVADFCAAEPTGDLPTGADYALLLFPPLALLAGTYGRFANQLRQDKWAALCQCSPETGAYCTVSNRYSFTYPSGTANGTCALGTNCSYTNSGHLTPTSATKTVSFPAGQHKTRITVHPDFNGTVEAYTDVDGETSLGPLTSGVDNVFVHSWSHSATGLEIVWFKSGGSGNGNAEVMVEFANDTGEAACTPAGPPFVPPGELVPPVDFPDPPAAPTCSTEQDVCTQLAALAWKLDFVRSEVELLLKRQTPYGYETLASHTGLTGSGTLSVADILGAVVVLTTVPTSWGQTGSSPRRLYPQVGEIHFGDSAYNGEAKALHYDEQMFLDVPPLTTEVVYSFRAGIVATITFLGAP
jgi:hypothetical protein